MSQLVLLDAGIIGLITHPHRSQEGLACAQWADVLVACGDLIYVPEIADYESRRELLRANKHEGLMRLDALAVEFGYVALTTNSMRLAADFWANARRQGRPTAPDIALDCDAILAAQAVDTAAEYGLPVVVATQNVAHLSRYVDARHWQNILPSSSSS